MWGRGDSGQLGLGDRQSKQIPVLNTAFPEGTEMSQARETDSREGGREREKEGEREGGRS